MEEGARERLQREMVKKEESQLKQNFTAVNTERLDYSKPDQKDVGGKEL